MNYFGKKSLSSVFSKMLHIGWYLVLVGAIVATIGGSFVMFSPQARDFISSEMIQKEQELSTKTNQVPIPFESKSFEAHKDRQDWETFKNLPIAARVVMLPYLWAITVLLLKIIKKTQLLFTNFKNDVVFDKNNALIISTISKLNIWFSIITFNCSSLLVSVLLFMLCDIIKNGSVLQEEHDLTV